MPKIKLQSWKGIYTNVDENEQGLETARTSINFSHNRGFLEFEPRNLLDYTLPNIDSQFGTGWNWETGVYTTLTNDPFDIDAVATKYDCLILVAKKEDSGTYHRLVYLKDLTNDSIWYELSANGNASNFIRIINHDGAGDFTNSYFSTTREGQAYFREESGHIKLFLPHSCFWIGRLERTVFKPAHGRYDYKAIDPTGWYIDKLVDSFDPLAELVDIETDAPYPHRMYWNGGISTSTSDVIRNKNVNLSDEVELSNQPIEDGHDERTVIYKFTGRFLEGGASLPTTVTPFAPSIASTLINSIYGYDSWSDYSSPELQLMVIQAEFFNFYEAYDSGTEEAIPIASIAAYEADMKIQILGESDPYTLSGRAGYIISRSDFFAQNWRYKGTESITDDGFDSAVKQFDLVITAVLDEREEIIIKHINKAVDESANWKIVITNGGLTADSNARVTRIRYYIKLEGEELFYLYHDTDCLATSDEYSNEIHNFDIIEADLTAISLAQNIGIEPDQKNWYTYTVIEGFRDFITESGVSIGISNNDYSNVYYSVLGGGNLQPDLMYTQNILQVAGANVVNAVAIINKNLAVITNDTTYIVKVLDDIGALVFTIDQALEFGVKDKNDIAQIQGGIAIHTKHGIYTTTGFESTLISDPLDDLVKDNFSTGRIYYNKGKHILYYKPTVSEDLYRFRFKDGVWEMINKTTTEEEVEEEIVVVD